MTEFDYQRPPEEESQTPPADPGEEQVDVRLLRQQLEMMRMESQQEIIILRQELESLRHQISAKESVAPPRADDFTHDFATNPDAGSRVDVGRPMDLSHQTYRPQENWNQDMSTLLERIERLGANPPPKNIFFREVFWAQLTGTPAANGTVTFKEMFNNSTGIAAMPGGRSADGTTNMTEVNGRGGATNGTIALVQAYQNANSTQYSYIAIGGSAIPVNLSQTGGADGDNSTAVSWTYTATEENGTTHTGLSPTHNRMFCKTMPGTKGTLWQHSDGTLELYQTDELPNFGTC